VNTYIALFRGINVGGKNILSMKALVGVLEEAGCKHVSTYIQSGNAVFQSSEARTTRIAEAIATGVMKSNGFTPKVLVLGVADLENAIENNPYKTTEGKTLHFFFLESRPLHPDLKGLMNVTSSTEEFGLVGRTFYLYAPDGIGRSKLAARAEELLGVSATARNLNTVSKLAAMVKQV